ncbi:rhodanese-like domain-containing protein [uncultured Halomonas sp.]|uniref:rhodanese-like domain-containing protein n=1 Tax=Halomonas mongoliensis TaxID=321265 RepID=UPI0026296773|nr:rhodanese-like domain-containing protein [uncultured Halomonas sp.]
MIRTLALLGGAAALLVSAAASAENRISAQETYELLQEERDNVLFIDVRDPVEVMFIGATNEVDRNIPFRVVDRESWNEERGHFAMVPNEDFAEQVAAALEEKGLDRSAMVITMCRSGSDRGEPSAAYLLEQGFESVRYVTHGFQGDPAESGEREGMRLVNGWQNSGLPWTRTLDADKAFR